MQKLFLVPLVGLALIATAGASSATMTCDPLQFVCTGDSGTDPYAHCDGTWADVYGILPYAQVCLGSDGTNHVCVEAVYDGVNSTCTIDLHA